MLESLQSSDFTPLLNQTFRIRTAANELLDVELVEVTEMGSGTAGCGNAPERRPFSIVFRGPMDVLIPQNIYEIEHEKLGTISLFMVPIGPDQKGMRYEAVFA